MMDGAWTPERNDSRQRRVCNRKKNSHIKKNSGKRIWTESGTGKATCVNRRRDSVNLLMSRFEINGLSKREYPEVELPGFKVDFQSEHEEEGKV
jgi:hypothetical protein